MDLEIYFTVTYCKLEMMSHCPKNCFCTLYSFQDTRQNDWTIKKGHYDLLLVWGQL